MNMNQIQWLNMSKLEKRDTAADIIRIIAAFTVVSVHFFLNNGFYSQTVVGNTMYIAVLVRTFFGICVPLFMILTGYLMSHKELNKKYYWGIRKTLSIYLLASIACMIYRHVHLEVEFTVKSAILEVLGFKGAPYSWYIEMYIGLFLMIPFLNLIYNNLKGQREKQILIVTLCVLTALPSICNIYNFDNASWWANPTTSDEFSKLIPSWWMGIYPITYYFIGCYLKEYNLKLKTKMLFLFLAMSTVGFGSFNFYRSHGAYFKTGTYAFWYGVQPLIMSVIVFVLLSRIKGEKIPKAGRFIIWKISNLALSIYLVSYIFDNYCYEKFCIKYPLMQDRMKHYFVIVPLVFFFSLLLSIGLELVDKLLCFITRKILAFVKAIKQEQSIDNKNLVFTIMMAIAVIFALWKCAYGFGGDDEAFYLTIPHRLSMGDALLKDEWHLSQLSGFFMMPFVAIYRTMMNSTEGIILAARYFYVFVHAGVAVFLYSRLKKFGWMSVIATGLYFIFTPYDIMAFSYNTMAIDLLAVTGVLMATTECRKKHCYMISGITFAAAVLCCPYLASVYFLYGICVLAHIVLEKWKKTKILLAESTFSPKTFAWFTCGVGSLAILFLIVVFSKIGIADITASLPGMFADPEHPRIALTQKLQSYTKAIYNCHPYFKIAMICYLILLIGMLIDEKRKNHRAFYLICSGAITIFCYVLFVPELTFKYYNALMVPMIFVGLTSYILCENKNKKLMSSVFILGILYSVCICIGSNQYFYVIAMALSVTNIASFVFVGQLLREMREHQDEVNYSRGLRYAALGMIGFIIVLQGFLQIKVKYNHCFWEAGNPKVLTQKIVCGPAKGIFTNEQKAQEYKALYDDLSCYKNKEPDKILLMTGKTWCYLELNKFAYGTYSEWLSGENDTTLQRLEMYYSVNKEKVPRYIYLPKNGKWNYSKIIENAKNHGYTIEENVESYKFAKENK